MGVRDCVGAGAREFREAKLTACPRFSLSLCLLQVQRSAAFDHDDDVFGVDAAATRDRTASASTSGHDHPASGARRAVVAGASARRASSARTPRRAAAESLAAPEHDAEDDDEQELAHHAPADANAAALHMNGVAVGVDAAGAAALLLPAVEAAEEKKSHKRGLSRPPGLTEARDRETHDELRACDDWRDVLDVVADEAAVEGLSARTSVQVRAWWGGRRGDVMEGGRRDGKEGGRQAMRKGSAG